jgi:hypothetical protein
MAYYNNPVIYCKYGRRSEGVRKYVKIVSDIYDIYGINPVHVRTVYIFNNLVIYWNYGRRKRVLKGYVRKAGDEKLHFYSLHSLVPAHVYACIAPSHPLVLRVFPTKDSHSSPTLCSYSYLCLLLAECSTGRVVLMALALLILLCIALASHLQGHDCMRNSGVWG